MAAEKVILYFILVTVFYGQTVKACTWDGDCPQFGEYCCGGDSYCQSDCLGLSCTLTSDCADYEHCCNNVCQSDDCYLAGWLVAVIVISVLTVIGAVVGVILCYFCSYSRRSPGLIVSAGAPSFAPITTTSVVSGSSVIHGQAYPIVQPGAPCYGQPPPPTHYPNYR